MFRLLRGGQNRFAKTPRRGLGTNRFGPRPVWLRAGMALVLLASAIASLVFGIRYHGLAVSFEREIEIDQAPPGVDPHGGSGFGPPGFGPPGEGPGDAWLAGPPPWMAPPPELLKIKQKVVLSEDTSEPALIREVTFGGVRLTSGILWRTYTGDPPSLCPT